MTGEFSSLEKTLIGLVLLGGALMMFFPLQYLLIGLLVFAGLTFLLANPKICFYLVVFTLPFAQINLINIAGHEVNPYNIVYHICIFATFFDFLNKKNINISTNLDKWFLVLSIIIIFAGFISPDSFGGMSIALRYLKAILLFYITVYFFRTNQVKLSTILKILLYSAIIQVVLVSCPFINNYFVHETLSPRGYLGLLGIGPLLVHQARGTFAMFSDFGYYLNLIIFLMMPMYKNIYKNKLLGKLIIAILFLGIFLTYSRGALLVFVILFFYHSFLISESKKDFLKNNLGLISCIVLFYLYFIFKTNFLDTLNSRDVIWDVHLSYIRDNINTFWIGNGWNSYFEILRPYIPANVPIDRVTVYFPHNYYLFLIEELGFIGGGIFISFLIYMFISSLKNISKGNIIQKNLNISLNISVLILFIAGIYDQSFYHPHLFTILIFIVALVYSKEKYSKIESDNLNL